MPYSTPLLKEHHVCRVYYTPQKLYAPYASAKRIQRVAYNAFQFAVFIRKHTMVEAIMSLEITHLGYAECNLSIMNKYHRIPGLTGMDCLMIAADFATSIGGATDMT